MNSQFEICGWFEEVWDSDSGRFLGTTPTTEQPLRKCGVEGEVTTILQRPLELRKGHKVTTLEASPARPRRLRLRYFPVCGRMVGKPT